MQLQRGQGNWKGDSIQMCLSTGDNEFLWVSWLMGSKCLLGPSKFSLPSLSIMVFKYHKYYVLMIFKKGVENIGVCLTNRVTYHLLFCILDFFNLYCKHLYSSNFFLNNNRVIHWKHYTFMAVEVYTVFHLRVLRWTDLHVTAVASFRREKIMGEKICLFKILVGIAKLFLKVVAIIYILLGDVLKVLFPNFWDKVNCRL